MSASAWQKLARAKEHFETLKAEKLAWRDGKPYSTRRERNPEGSRYSVVLSIDIPPDLVRFSLIAGDCFHNLRSALDHLAYSWAINHSGSLTDQEIRVLQFPVCIKLTDFPSQHYRIKPMSPAARAFIESVQPYHPRHPEPSALGILSKANNIDKHRLLNVTQELISSGEVEFTDIPGVAIEVHWPRVLIQHDAEVVFLTVCPPHPHVEYKCNFTLDIALKHDPVGQHQAPMTEMLTLLNVAITETEEIIRSGSGIQ